MSKKYRQTYRSDALASIHGTMEALHKVGAIAKQTMRLFEEACLTPVRPLTPRGRLKTVYRPPMHAD